MSLILKGVGMPEKGETLILKIKDSRIYREYTRYKFQPTRIKDAEAIQIPKDHGNIIDGHAFIRHLQDIFCDKCEQHKKYGGVVCRTCYINDVVLEYGDAPTILEAEDE